MTASPQTLNGTCLCGAVRVSATPPALEMSACHCATCRNWGGGPLLAVECHEGVEWEGEEHIGVYDSSEWAQRGFCKQCGTHLFYRLRENGFHAIPAGLFAHMGQFAFTMQVFIDQKPANYRFDAKTRDLTGAELFAQFDAE